MAAKNRRSNILPPTPAPAPTPVAATFAGGTKARQHLSARVDADIHQRFKAAVTARGMVMGVVLEKLMADWLARHENEDIRW